MRTNIRERRDCCQQDTFWSQKQSQKGRCSKEKKKENEQNCGGENIWAGH